MNVPKPLLTAWIIASIAMIEAFFYFDFNMAVLYSSPVFAARIAIYLCLYFLLRRFYQANKNMLRAFAFRPNTSGVPHAVVCKSVKNKQRVQK